MPVNVENKRRLAKEQYARWRSQVIEYLGGQCVKCGTDQQLETDHITRTDKDYNIAARWSRPWETQLAELDKCQLLCHECHLQKTAVDIGVPHGGGKCGKHGCKCTPCRLKKNEYLREFKKRKRAEAKAIAS